jgi:alpha-ketoglutarate-dependent taurine dioxygenase
MNTHNTDLKVQLPLVVQLNEMDPQTFIAYYRERKDEWEDRLTRAGAIKFTGVHIDSMETFRHISHSISDRFMPYIDGNSPRTKLADTVYTSTEYDKTRKITMHNELSYSAKWPNKLFFSCLQPAATGGETLLADSRDILKRMNKDIIAEITAKGVMYIRNLHGGMGVGPTWQDTFETQDQRQVEAFCKAYHIRFEWRENNTLRLKQFSPGIIEHRDTGEKVWFNQIDQFHPSHLGSDLLEVIQMVYESPENFPQYVKFGDGTEITEALVQEILDAIDQVTIAPPWSRNELLIIDNELVAHGRNSFSGDRKVLVTMSE